MIERSNCDVLHELADKVDRYESAKRCAQTAEQDLREAFAQAGPLGQALAPIFFDRGPAPWEAPITAATWPVSLYQTEPERTERFEAFVAAIDPDPIAEAYELQDEAGTPPDEAPTLAEAKEACAVVLGLGGQAEALAEMAALVTPAEILRPDPEPAQFISAASIEAGKLNTPEIPDGSIDLDEPITLNALAQLIGVSPPVVYDAQKLGALPPNSLVYVPEMARPKVIPSIALRGWCPTKARDRVRELLGETA